MPVYAAIYVPELSAQALLRLQSELCGKAAAVIEGECPFERICSMNTKARKLGVQAGMTRAEAESFTILLLRRSAKGRGVGKVCSLELPCNFLAQNRRASW